MLAVYRLPHFFGFFFRYKNLHIEAFNYTIKMDSFWFSLNQRGYLSNQTQWKWGLSSTPFYRFQCHYPLIIYLSLDKIVLGLFNFISDLKLHTNLGELTWNKIYTMSMLNTFFNEMTTQSKTALSFGTRLIVLRGRNTRKSFNDLSFWPVGVPLKMESMMK